VRVLLTRPEADAARTWGVLEARGHRVLVAPVLRIETVATKLGAGPWTALVMTSGNAARAVAGHPQFRDIQNLPVFAVGRRTAAAAREAGFAAVTSADGDVAALAALAARLAATGARLLHLAGEDLAGGLSGALARHGIVVETAAIYRAVPAQSLGGEAERALAAGRIDAVLHYSPRSAAAFVTCAERSGHLSAARDIAHCCLSAAVAAPLAAAGARRIRVAARPDETALIDLLEAGRGG
jgi:uroporphyrinogen-III synthase